RVEDIAGLVVLLFSAIFGFGWFAISFHGCILPEITRDCKTAICFCDAILVQKVDSMPVLTHRLETKRLA
ncbi:MAG: hypothetical protein ACRCUY_11045, partial [Thermoguttaceae bacterium]